MRPFGRKAAIGGFLLKGMVLCLSFVLVFLITYYLNQNYLARTAATARVVTARQSLLPGQALTEAELTLAERPLFGLEGDFSRDPKALLEGGTFYIGEIGVEAGDIIRPSRLLSQKPELSGPERIREALAQGDKRLLTLKTDLVASGGDWLVPGMRADAFVYLETKNSFGEVLETQVLGPKEDPYLEGLLIADRKNAAGQSLEISGEERVNTDFLPAAVVVVLEADESERAKALVRYNEEGRIYFSPVGGKEDVTAGPS